MRHGMVCVLAALTAWVVTGCNSASDQATTLDNGLLAPPPGSVQGPVPSPSGGPSDTCVSADTNHLCIGLKVVAYKDPNGAAILSRDDASTLVNGINGLWQVCNLGFQIDEYDAVDPTAYGLSYGTASQNELGSIRQQFSNSTTFLVAATGPWNSTYIAWTEMPGGAPYGTVVDGTYAKDPVTVGHELGHYMGLDHDPNVGNLMYYIAYPTDTAITSAQCDSARQTTLSDWQAMLHH